MFLYTAKIYNYDGMEFCFMGKGKLGKQDGVLTLSIPPRIMEESVTGRFLCIPDSWFRRCHRNEPMVIRIGERRLSVLIDTQIEFFVS